MAHHSDDSPWLCSECPRTYKTKADLIQHQRIHLQTHDCKSCGLSFPTRVEYISHHRTHVKDPSKTQPTKTVPKQCHICDKMFINLRAHIQSVHENIRQYGCNVCTKAFAKKSGLDRHIITVHDKMKHWSCDVCDKRFGEKTLLTRHLKIHAKAKLVEKTENGEDEEVIVGMKKHMRCGVCSKVLNSPHALKRHKMFVHEKKQKLLCNFCPKLFGE